MDVIILIFLAIRMAGLAGKKGLSVTKWVIGFVLAWILGEIVGAVIGMSIFGKDNVVSWALVGLAGAFAAYFIIKSRLDKLPDLPNNNDIENSGR